MCSDVITSSCMFKHANTFVNRKIFIKCVTICLNMQLHDKMSSCIFQTCGRIFNTFEYVLNSKYVLTRLNMQQYIGNVWLHIWSIQPQILNRDCMSKLRNSTKYGVAGYNIQSHVWNMRLNFSKMWPHVWSTNSHSNILIWHSNKELIFLTC